MVMDAVSKKTLIQENSLHESDTGSVFVQCALLTQRIESLTEHLRTHKKDHSARRGLLILVAHRRHLLKYMKSCAGDEEYQKFIKKFKIRG